MTDSYYNYDKNQMRVRFLVRKKNEASFVISGVNVTVSQGVLNQKSVDGLAILSPTRIITLDGLIPGKD